MCFVLTLGALPEVIRASVISGDRPDISVVPAEYTAKYRSLITSSWSQNPCDRCSFSGTSRSIDATISPSSPQLSESSSPTLTCPYENSWNQITWLSSSHRLRTVQPELRRLVQTYWIHLWQRRVWRAEKLQPFATNEINKTCWSWSMWWCGMVPGYPAWCSMYALY